MKREQKKRNQEPAQKLRGGKVEGMQYRQRERKGERERLYVTATREKKCTLKFFIEYLPLGLNDVLFFFFFNKKPYFDSPSQQTAI